MDRRERPVALRPVPLGRAEAAKRVDRGRHVEGAGVVPLDYLRVRGVGGAYADR